MKDYDCVKVRVLQIQAHIQQAAKDANVKIQSDATIFSKKGICQSEVLAVINLMVTLPSGLSVSAAIDVIYDYFGFVGVHMLPLEKNNHFRLKPRRAKGSLNRVMKSFVNQLITIEGGVINGGPAN